MLMSVKITKIARRYALTYPGVTTAHLYMLMAGKTELVVLQLPKDFLCPRSF